MVCNLWVFEPQLIDAHFPVHKGQEESRIMRSSMLQYIMCDNVV